MESHQGYLFYSLGVISLGGLSSCKPRTQSKITPRSKTPDPSQALSKEEVSQLRLAGTRYYESPVELTEEESAEVLNECEFTFCLEHISPTLIVLSMI